MDMHSATPEDHDRSEATDRLPPLPMRPLAGHKGTFGTVCVVGGQGAAPHVMLGGPAFSALAALRAGAGLALLAVPAPLMAAALSVAPSATGLALPVDEDGVLQPSACAELLDAALPRIACLAIGPGLGTGEGTRQMVLRLVTLEECPMVIDADALNALAQTVELQRDFRACAILTPHPGEFQRLAAALAISADPVAEASRPDAAAQLSRRLGCVTVLKGHRTVVSDGLRTWTCAAGGPALATAGSGDVLTGVVASFVAQFHRARSAQQGGSPAAGEALAAAALSLYDCARLAVEVHARAGDAWSRRHGAAGMLATDLISELPDVLNAMRVDAAR